MPDRVSSGLQCLLRPGRPPARAYHFRLARRILVADAPLGPLAPFAVAASTFPDANPAPPLTGPGRFVRRSTGWIADAWREVEVWRHEEGLRLQLAGVGGFAVTVDGIAVIGEAEASTVTAATRVEALLGAPLVLALALRGVWCLHASAVAVDGSVIAFAGESGSGKSTLAEYLKAAEEGGSRRVADDTLPVQFGPKGLLALPHFPQLKLPAAEHYLEDAPAALPLAAAFVIGPLNGDEAVSVSPLDRRQAMQALIRHTVAARLFDKPLLAAHLDFCAEAAARIPVWRLAYPHRREVLPQVQEAIRRSLSESPAGGGRRAVNAGAGK